MSHALKLAEMVEAAISVFELMEAPAMGDPDHQDSIAALGNRIGFGALMIGAEAEWRKISAVAGGEFTVGPCRMTVTKILPQLREALAAYRQPPSQTAHPTEGELLPCPFCGETDFAMGDVEDTAYFASCSSGGHAVNCPSCGTIGPSGTTAHEAITTWNTRPVVRPQGEEGLREAAREVIAATLDGCPIWIEGREILGALLRLEKALPALSNQGKASS